MGRSDAITAHLPSLYSEGELVGSFADTIGVQLDMLDELQVILQQSHWFDSTRNLFEAEALAAVLDIRVEEFHASLGEYRAWVHAMTNARLHEGAVTREALRILVDVYATGFQDAAGIDMFGAIPRWGDPANSGSARLVENPQRMRHARLPAAGEWEPLSHLNVVNSGIDPASWAVVFTGHPNGPEYAPFLANRTTGEALVVRQKIPVGSRLTIAPSAADPNLLRADLDGHDITDRLDQYPDLIPGPHGPGTPVDVPGSTTLALGANDFWFLPLAHFNTDGLDRFLLALATDSLRMGRYDETLFDDSLFIMGSLVSGWIVWVEHEPASIEVRLPAQAMFASNTADALAARERMEVGLDEAVDRTAAVGVATDVVLQSHGERQPSQARLVGMIPITVVGVGPTGADLLADGEGRFSVSDFDDSVMR
jgi:hypothetical protein